MGGCSPDHGAGAVVRGHGQLPGVGHGGDFAGFGQAAAPAQVEHGHTGHASLQVVLKAPFVAQRLAGADQRVAVFGVLLQQVEAVHTDRVFVPEGVEFFQRTGNFLRHGQAPQAVELDHDVHLVAHCITDLAEGLQRQIQVGVADVLAVAFFSGGVKRPDLHGRDALP